jgi:hypothetical protein
VSGGNSKAFASSLLASFCSHISSKVFANTDWNADLMAFWSDILASSCTAGVRWSSSSLSMVTGAELLFSGSLAITFDIFC